MNTLMNSQTNLDFIFDFIICIDVQYTTNSQSGDKLHMQFS